MSRKQGSLTIAGGPCVSYDPSGAVFAVTLNLKSSVLMYDMRNFDKVCERLCLSVLMMADYLHVIATGTFPSRIHQ